MNLKQAICCIYPDLEYISDFEVLSDNSIVWNTIKYSQPTQQQINDSWNEIIKKEDLKDFVRLELQVQKRTKEVEFYTSYKNN
jgi:hypothetical protein